MTDLRESGVTLYGQVLGPEELRRRVGRLEQVAGIESFTYDDGPERGVRALRVRTGTGFAFTVLADRGLDIGDAEFRGMALAWSSPTGVTGPWYHEPEGTGWLRSFHGGLVVTCGLQHAGRPSERDGEPLGMHGRVSNLSASHVAREVRWDDDGCVLEVRGQVRETRVFGSDLVMSRRITARVGESTLRIEDAVENRGWSSAPLMLLYHINLGWPLLADGSRLIGPGAPGEIPEPHEAGAAAGGEAWDRFAAPTPGFRERSYYHRPRPEADGWAEARLENPRLGGGLALRVRFRPEELPEFVQWTMTGEGTYVLGLEPATCRLTGYPAERAAGRVIDLQPGETRRFSLEIGVEAARRGGSSAWRQLGVDECQVNDGQPRKGSMSVSARLNRLFNGRSGRCFDVAIDHGFFNEPSFLKGIEDIARAIRVVVDAAPDAIQLTIGQARHLQALPGREKPSLVLRTDVANVYGTSLPRALFSRMIDAPVEQALRLDATCVVVNLFRIPDQPEVTDQCIGNILRIKPECDRYGMPLMIEPLVFQPNERAGGYMVDGDEGKIIPLVRQAVELGADIIKADPTSDPSAYHEVVRIAGGVPVLVRGGSRATDEEILQRTEELIRQGAAGIVYGRNIIQHPNPGGMTRALMAVVHAGASAREARELVTAAAGPRA